MAKIVCEECGTEYKYEVAKNMKNCPVCGALMMGDNDTGHMESPDKNSGEAVEKKTYYYCVVSESQKKNRKTFIDVKFVKR